MTNVLKKNKAEYRCERCLGDMAAILDRVIKEGFFEEVMPSLRPK